VGNVGGAVKDAAKQQVKKAAKAHAKKYVYVGLAVLTIAVVLLVLMIALVTGVPSAGDAAAIEDLEGFLTEEQMERLRELAEEVHRPPDVPLLPFALYLLAADAHGLDWAVLAGIGKVECDHGRSQLAGCNPPGTINEAGARGPMQFLGSTWRAGAGQFTLDVSGPPVPDGQENRGYATDADEDGTADPWVANDAVHAAARLLVHNGAPDDVERAILAYNHSGAYVAEVQRWASIYRAAAAAGPAPPGEGGAAGADTVGVSPVTCPDGRTITVASSIAAPVQDLLDAAAADGLQLCGWGYRSGAQQIALRRAHCGPSDYAIYEMPSSQCRPPTARPGSSKHETGLAIDFERCAARSTACFQWLAGHAADHGLYNFPPEPWHWSVDGT
jgi:hypothetical protein